MVAALKKVIELNPDHTDALNYLGYSYADKGINLDEALSLIRRALELKPESGYITDSLGWLYFKMGRYEDALFYLKKAAEIVKDDPVIFEHLGDVYAAEGKSDEALKTWEKAIELHEKEEGLKGRVEEKIRNLKNKGETDGSR
jgi:tetratricopeptide (TPR) repeat protein